MPALLSSGRICRNCGCNVEVPGIVFITPSEPETQRKSTSHEKWVWLILAMIMATMVLALSR